MKPLQGIRVLAVEQYGAGPYGTMHMADLGADVIKIEPPPRPGTPAGDNARHSGPHFLGADDSQFFQTFNRSKRSVMLDIRHPDGRAVLRRLAAKADAVVNNLRGDQPGKLGITYDALSDVNARLVCGHLSGYGRSGPRADWPAYDYLLQAEAGYLDLTGDPGGGPTRMGLSIIDFMTGVTTAFAVTAALLGAFRSGKGCDVDVTLYDVAMHQLTYPAAWYVNEGHVTGRRPRSGHPSVVPCELFPTADGWIFVMCITPRFWASLCEAIGRPELTRDARFVGFPERFANRDALAGILDGEFRRAGSEEWLSRLAGKVPVARVLTMSEALDNPYFREAGGLLTMPHPARGAVQVVASPIRIDGARPGGEACRALGADTDAVLEEAGLGAMEIAGLRAQGVI
ncbi:CoA transferase [Vineibacter terrae]|uniref:CoA transferase n=1 Tax=Vineibacter terrae TaxID=2586908 RepID=A0A5C8PPV7_9HYPH|nr:CoA transferase [Vineibacter terrae]TXL76417.1 CoA transferase [Vineibacter terrae]